MKTKVYLRIGREEKTKKVKVEASANPNLEPLHIGTPKYSKRAIPTVFMALDLEIPDEAFRPPNISALIKVPLQKVGTAIEVVDPLIVLGRD